MSTSKGDSDNNVQVHNISVVRSEAGDERDQLLLSKGGLEDPALTIGGCDATANID